MPGSDAGIRWDTAEPAPAGDTLAALLHDLRAYIHRYVVVTIDQATTIGLWIAHTHAFDAADCTPYLQVTSATFGSGKTRLLEIADPIVRRPWFTSRTSAAALVRKIDQDSPTLLLDESDAAFKSDREYAEALRGILNSGYKRNGAASLCVGKGADLSVRDFSTFCPKMIAGIGELPDTVASRAIPIVLKRKLATEPVQRWRDRDGRAEADPLRHRLMAWREGAVDALRSARPAIPTELTDRAADVWEPLLAIADLADGEWPIRARRAAVAIMGVQTYADPAIELLKDIRDEILVDQTDSIIPSKLIIEKLTVLDDRPWATWAGGRPLTTHALARLLGRFQLHPVRLEHLRGYRRDALDALVSRYLEARPSDCQNPNKDAGRTRDGFDFFDPSRNANRQAVSPIKTALNDDLTLEMPGTPVDEVPDERV